MLRICLISIFVVNLVSCYTRCDIKDPTTALFHGRINTTMENEMEAISNITKHSCMKRCRDHQTCLAFSYAYSTSSCNLYQYTSESADMSLTPAPGVWFYDMQNYEKNTVESYIGRCSEGHHCRNGGSCINDCSTNSYFCACTDLYHGEFCQEAYLHVPVIFQTISVSAAESSIGFTHMDIHYLIIGHFNVLAQVYKYNVDQGLYEFFVSLPDTNYVFEMTTFDINNRRFICVINHFEATSDTTSRLFVINDATGDFEVYQTFATYQPTSVFYLRATDGNRYLFISNHYSGTQNYLVNSVVYVWDDVAKQFTQDSLLESKGGYHSTMFEADGDVHVAISNYYNPTTEYSKEVSIYKMDSPGSWSLFQSLPESANGATAVKSFETDRGLFLVVIRHLNCIQQSNVYKWNGASKQFDIIQRIPMINCPVNSEIFKVGGEVFMIVAHVRGQWLGTDVSVPNIIYKLEGEMFVQYSSLPGREVWNWNSFERNGEIFLCQSNRRAETTFSTDATNFKIFQWK